MKTVHFIAGLPRSGSTLLVNLLAQNPRFHIGGTSPLVDMLLLVRHAWDQSPEARAMGPADSEAAKLRVLKGSFDGFFDRYGPDRHSHTFESWFDKSRSWLAHLEMLEAIYEQPVKVLVPVRDVRDVLSSFERLWRKASATRQIPLEHRHYGAFQSLPGRLQVYTAADGWVGVAFNRILDAVKRGFRDRLHFVRYEDLCRYPMKTMIDIYDFLGEQCQYTTHDFDNVEPVTQEDDAVYGFPGLHDIRGNVEPARSHWQETLGDTAQPFALWNDLLNEAINQPARATGESP